MSRKKGFTLIEIMIVIAIMGLLSMILIPKVGVIKLQSKNKSVSTNVLLVRTYLENRSGKEGISYQVSLNAKKTQEQALTTILNNIGTDMTSKFSGSNAFTNPFSNNSSIVYSQGNVTSSATSSASSVLVYYCIDALPADNNAVNNSTVLPKGAGFTGNVVVVVYSTGYVLYGLDNSGQLININIIKFPPTPPQSGVAPGTGGNSDIAGNIGDVVSYIKSIAIENIIKGVPNGQMWNVIQRTLYDGLVNKFTPGDTSKDIVNPYFLNVDAIGNENSWVKPDLNYSIISVPQPGSDVDTKYSNRLGTVIAYVKTTDPVGYVVYGVDKNSNNVGYTTINLSTEVTSQMTQTLGNNVIAVYNALISYVDSNISKSPYGNVQNMTDLAYSQLQNLTINNAYISSWSGKKETNSGSFEAGYVLVVGGNDGGASYSDYKGSVIVDTLSNGSGYEIYGIDYNGNKYAYIKLVSVNDNFTYVVNYLNSISEINDVETMYSSISNHFNTNLVNPYNSTANAIVLASNGNTNINSQNSVIVCAFKTDLDYSKYKGSVIVEEHDNSGKHYTVYSIGYDGTVMKIADKKY